jgi:putative ABC transport system permease protein
MYAPFLQNPLLFMTLLVRTTGEPTSVAGPVRAAVWSVDKDQPVAPMVTMEQILERSVAQPRFRTLLLTVFAALALALAAMGVYGVMAYFVEQRTREIGLRMALGAKTGDVLRLIVGYSLKLTLIGVVIGLGASFLLTRLVASLLYNVSALDRATFAATPLLIVLVTLIATYVPARKAMKVDPMMALRHE